MWKAALTKWKGLASRQPKVFLQEFESSFSNPAYKILKPPTAILALPGPVFLAGVVITCTMVFTAAIYYLVLETSIDAILVLKFRAKSAILVTSLDPGLFISVLRSLLSLVFIHRNPSTILIVGDHWRVKCFVLSYKFSSPVTTHNTSPMIPDELRYMKTRF